MAMSDILDFHFEALANTWEATVLLRSQRPLLEIFRNFS